MILGAQRVIDHINQDELARFLAMKNPDESAGAKARMQKMEAQEGALITAYSTIAQAIFDRDPKVCSHYTLVEIGVSIDYAGKCLLLAESLFRTKSLCSRHGNV